MPDCSKEYDPDKNRLTITLGGIKTNKGIEARDFAKVMLNTVKALKAVERGISGKRVRTKWLLMDLSMTLEKCEFTIQGVPKGAKYTIRPDEKSDA